VALALIPNAEDSPPEAWEATPNADEEPAAALEKNPNADEVD